MSQHQSEVNAPGRWSVLADLGFWIVAGVIVAAVAQPLADTWGAPRNALLAASIAILGTGLVALVLLWRVRPMPTRVIRSFGLGNLVITPVALAASMLDWLGLTASGNMALAAAAGVTLVFGAWQLGSARRATPADRALDTQRLA